MTRPPPPNRIGMLRRLRRLSMRELARRAGTTASTIDKLEKGKMNLTQRWMNRLAEALGAQPVDLIALPTAAHIDAKLLTVALEIAEAVLKGEPAEIRASVLGDYTAAAYDVLVETEAEGTTIDDTLIKNLVETNRRRWLGVKREQ